ncbi:energy transducer TonB [Blastopirellula sp. JC732]|uniref:Energy transducer TonB n=1 Tax=Blastopirellula sediminis TaxID=2894196 RepID=A0A9X1MT62_9BACT|nr:energy transducer TonB [Blastopirellula sediminis]MCC9605571.1 energy transducer TonB [Blastopirellula sediminis]MCC9631129.1 energy transducer TonB [Blastopirellula sediminis]
MLARTSTISYFTSISLHVAAAAALVSWSIRPESWRHQVDAGGTVTLTATMASAESQLQDAPAVEIEVIETAEGSDETTEEAPLDLQKQPTAIPLPLESSEVIFTPRSAPAAMSRKEAASQPTPAETQPSETLPRREATKEPLPESVVAEASPPTVDSVAGARIDVPPQPTPTNAAPGYPPTSRSRREEGRVILRVTISATGEVAEVEIFQSSGFERLDQAALLAVKQWKFTPAQSEGRNVATRVKIPVSFSLRTD